MIATQTGNFFVDTLATIVGAIFLAGFFWAVRKINTLAADASETKNAVAGRKPTELEPNPPPGLAAVTVSNTLLLKKHDDLFFRYLPKIDQILRGTNTLVTDSLTTNGGGTTRAAIERIESAVTLEKET